MNIISYVSSETDIEECAASPGIQEVLIEPAGLAREGQLSKTQAERLAKLALQKGIRPVLVWDILMSCRAMQIAVAQLREINRDLFSAIRVQDPGAAQWVLENYLDTPIQYIAETGNHNYEALSAWREYFGDRLERLVLSIELPEEILIDYIQRLSVPCEILGAGRILLFYSPRLLLSPNFLGSDAAAHENGGSRWIEVLSASEDSHMRAFPTLETDHGTFMFLDKDQYILHKLENLKKAKIHTIRIDLRHLSTDFNAAAGLQRLCLCLSQGVVVPPTEWPRKTLAPFFKSNNTTKQFSKLKNKMRAFRDNSCVAEVVSAEKGKAVGFYTLREFESTAKFTVLFTTGETADLDHLEFYSMSGERLDTIGANRLVTTPWLKRVSTGCLLRRPDA